MGLNMVVGVLADDFTEDDDAFLAELTAIGEALRRATATSRPPAGWQRHGVESYLSLQLLRAAKLSVATGSAIAFC